MTLLEVTAVMVIGAILAASVIPAMARTDAARKNAGVSEVARLFTYARERAIASGMPVGVRVDQDAGSIGLWLIRRGSAPAPLPSPLGEAGVPTLLGSRFGVTIEGAEFPVTVSAAPAADEQVLWFDYAGVPHARGIDGILVGPLSGDSEVRFGHGARVVVSSVSGLVEAINP
jgi:Tfp pilus assembly protein FimT